MLSLLEAYELALAYDRAHSKLGVSNITWSTDEWVFFESVRPEWEGWPGYAVNRHTGEVDLNCAANRSWIFPILDDPALTRIELDLDSD